jgi:hypothetical protein
VAVPNSDILISTPLVLPLGGATHDDLKIRKKDSEGLSIGGNPIRQLCEIAGMDRHQRYESRELEPIAAWVKQIAAVPGVGGKKHKPEVG